MKNKWVTISLVAVTVCLCVGGAVGISMHKSQQEKEASAQLANPFQDDLTPEQAAEITGFSFELPEAYDGFQRSNLRASSVLIEGIYAKGDDQICVRKGTGKDISGDYNRYERSDMLSVDGTPVIARGSSDGFFAAIWTKNENAYSLTSSVPLSEQQVSDWVRQLR